MTWEGTQVGHYKIEGKLGEGAMGVVYLALDTKLRKQVVFKILNAAFAKNRKVHVRFLNEALIQANLPNDNIVKALDIIERDDMLALVLEYVQGLDLEKYLVQQGGRLDLATIARLMGPSIGAIQCAHENQVVHRDLKPANILIDQRSGKDIPRVADFGIAKLKVDGAPGLTRDGSLLGTPSYMSPEQLRGDLDRIDHRTDIYALGAILYQLATGSLPHGEASEYEVGRRVLSGEQPMCVSQVNPSFPPAYDVIVMRAMAFEPDQRYPSAAALGEDLQAVAAGLKPTAMPSMAPSSTPATVYEHPAPVYPGTNPARAPVPPNVRPADTPGPLTPYPTPGSNWKPLAVLGTIVGVAIVIAALIVSGNNKATNNAALARLQAEKAPAVEARKEPKEPAANVARAEAAGKAARSEAAAQAARAERTANAARHEAARSVENDAERAYLASLDAYSRGDSNGYLGAYDFPMDCFYNKPAFSRDSFYKARKFNFNRGSKPRNRMVSGSVRVLRKSDNEVVLHDVGNLVKHNGTVNPYDKGVVMKKKWGAWKVVTEVNRGADRCYPGLF